MKNKMHTVPIEINTRDPFTKIEGIIQAIRFRDIKYLAWHSTLEKLVGKGNKSWTVTHVPTGLAIMMFNKRYKCREFAYETRKFDWNFNEKDFEEYEVKELTILKNWLLKIASKIENKQRKANNDG